jgi:excisionase family DNA binding protein
VDDFDRITRRGGRLRIMAARFLTLADVTEILNISAVQAYNLVRSGELPAIQIGPRGIWRVEATELEAYIQRLYSQTRSRTGGDPTAGRDGEERSDVSELAPQASETRHQV